MNALIENNPANQSWEKCLVADIGGTHARFAIASISADFVSLEHEETYLVQSFESISAAMLDYTKKIPASAKPVIAVLAVATAVTHDHIAFTNSHWSFSICGLKKELALIELTVINDFAAVAWALPRLVQNDIEVIGSGAFQDMPRQGVYAALGPGTGLGVAALKIEAGHSTVLETEGGHISYAPRTNDEIKILQLLQKDYGRVSFERLLCGSGLFNLYRARCQLMQVPSILTTPEAVSSAARKGDLAAQAAAQDFCSILGAFAGDAVLMFGAWQGVYLSGGLLPHVMDEKGKALFRQAFEDKGRFSSLLSQTPTCLIKRADIGKLGAANLWLSHKK